MCISVVSSVNHTYWKQASPSSNTSQAASSTSHRHRVSASCQSLPFPLCGPKHTTAPLSIHSHQSCCLVPLHWHQALRRKRDPLQRQKRRARVLPQNAQENNVLFWKLHRLRVESTQSFRAKNSKKTKERFETLNLRAERPSLTCSRPDPSSKMGSSAAAVSSPVCIFLLAAPSLLPSL